MMASTAITMVGMAIPIVGSIDVSFFTQNPTLQTHSGVSSMDQAWQMASRLVDDSAFAIGVVNGAPTATAAARDPWNAAMALSVAITS